MIGKMNLLLDSTKQWFDKMERTAHEQSLKARGPKDFINRMRKEGFKVTNPETFLKRYYR